MFRVVAFVLFVIAAVLAFISDLTNANIALLFIVGVISAGLACLSLDPTWRPGPPA